MQGACRSLAAHPTSLIRSCAMKVSKKIHPYLRPKHEGEERRFLQKQLKNPYLNHPILWLKAQCSSTKANARLSAHLQSLPTALEDLTGGKMTRISASFTHPLSRPTSAKSAFSTAAALSLPALVARLADLAAAAFAQQPMAPAYILITDLGLRFAVHRSDRVRPNATSLAGENVSVRRKGRTLLRSFLLM